MSQEDRGSVEFDQVEDTFEPPGPKRVIRISRPNVRNEVTRYNGKDGRPPIFFEPGDRVHVQAAGGWVNTGGAGATCKRYVDPQGANSGELYHGKIQIPGMPDLVRIVVALEQTYEVPGDIDPTFAFLRLGYEDDDYSDNGYWGKDDGDGQVGSDDPPAYVVLEVTPRKSRRIIQPNIILEIDHYRAPGPNPDPTWAPQIAGNAEYMGGFNPDKEWIQVTTSDQVEQRVEAISGWAIKPKISDEDVPFTHPFGFDWEFYVAPDPGFEGLLAESNRRPQDEEYQDANQHAHGYPQLQHTAGILGVEVEKWQIPNEFRAKEGDRVAVFGRWIVDTGHDDFHTEIHPPLMLVKARASDDDSETSAFIWGRPYLVDQLFDGDGLFEHLVWELAKVASPIPLSRQVEAHPTLLKPFVGSHVLHFRLKPPFPRVHPNDQLMAEYYFTTRSNISVSVLSSDRPSDKDSLLVAVTFDGNRYVTPPEPERYDRTWEASDLDALKKGPGLYLRLAEWVFLAAPFVGIPTLGGPILKLNPGVETHEFGMSADLTRGFWQRWPDWSSKRLNRSPAATLIGRSLATVVDDTQPFPVLGQVILKWKRWSDIVRSVKGRPE